MSNAPPCSSPRCGATPKPGFRPVPLAKNGLPASNSHSLKTKRTWTARDWSPLDHASLHQDFDLRTCFTGAPIEVVTPGHGSDDNQSTVGGGAFWHLHPLGLSSIRHDLAISQQPPVSNWLTHAHVLVVPPGIKCLRGIAAPMHGLPGGGTQLWLPSELVILLQEASARFLSSKLSRQAYDQLIRDTRPALAWQKVWWQVYRVCQAQKDRETEVHNQLVALKMLEASRGPTLNFWFHGTSTTEVCRRYRHLTHWQTQVAKCGEALMKVRTQLSPAELWTEGEARRGYEWHMELLYLARVELDLVTKMLRDEAKADITGPPGGFTTLEHWIEWVLEVRDKPSLTGNQVQGMDAYLRYALAHPGYRRQGQTPKAWTEGMHTVHRAGPWTLNMRLVWIKDVQRGRVLWRYYRVERTWIRG